MEEIQEWPLLQQQNILVIYIQVGHQQPSVFLNMFQNVCERTMLRYFLGPAAPSDSRNALFGNRNHWSRLDFTTKGSNVLYASQSILNNPITTMNKCYILGGIAVGSHSPSEPHSGGKNHRNWAWKESSARDIKPLRNYPKGVSVLNFVLNILGKPQRPYCPWLFRRNHSPINPSFQFCTQLFMLQCSSPGIPEQIITNEHIVTLRRRWT